MTRGSTIIPNSHSKAATPSSPASSPPATFTSSLGTAFDDFLALPAVPVPLFGGMLVGVYLTPSQFVKDVNLAVALPVMLPGVKLTGLV